VDASGGPKREESVRTGGTLRNRSSQEAKKNNQEGSTWPKSWQKNKGARRISRGQRGDLERENFSDPGSPSLVRRRVESIKKGEDQSKDSRPYESAKLESAH